MNSKAEVIAVSSDRPPYPQSKSKWFGRAKRDRFRLVFSFYSPDGCEISMPIASMSAYLKKQYPEVELLLDPYWFSAIQRNTQQRISPGASRNMMPI